MSALQNDKLDAMILLSSHVLAEKSAAALLSADITDAEIPKSLYNKIQRIIKREHWKREYKGIISVGKRIAAVFLIFCTILFALAMSVKAVREALWKTLVEWYEDYIAISYRVDNDKPDMIVMKKEPINIPNEWKREVIIDSSSMFYIQFILEGKKIVTYQQEIFDNNEVWIDNETSTVEEIQIGDNIGTFVELNDKKTHYLIWTDGVYSYVISGDSTMVNRETLIEIAASIP